MTESTNPGEATAVLTIQYPAVFIFTLGRYGISPFPEDPAELHEDLTHALRASNPE